MTSCVKLLFLVFRSNHSSGRRSFTNQDSQDSVVNLQRNFGLRITVNPTLKDRLSEY